MLKASQGEQEKQNHSDRPKAGKDKEMNKLRHATTNYKALYPFIAGMDGENNYRKFTSGEYMPLVIEWIYCSDYKGRPIFSLAHYGEQNGDLMRDPEMTIAVDFEAGTIEPMTWRNDYLGGWMRYINTTPPGSFSILSGSEHHLTSSCGCG